MNKQTRIQKISEAMEQDPISKKEIMWKDRLMPFPVYQIPLDCLIYNKYNGRILSRTKSLEHHDKRIDAESKEGKKIIRDFLWDSKEQRNKKTKKDIEDYGQKEVGIITKDGIIIDGNRRVMILNEIEKYRHFKAIVLPVELEQNPHEIRKLETSYQMGEDEKLDYNPIEKYLKAKNLKDEGVSIEDIANWMGESVSTIEKDYLSVMKTMDDYLDDLGYKGIYTQLDGREDHFIQLTKWLDTFDGEGSSKAFDGYTNGDVVDLKAVAFDYIRAKFEGKRFRLLGDGLQPNHFFGNREIWTSFNTAHVEKVEPIRINEKDINFDSLDITKHLNDRDNKFIEEAKELLNENLSEHQEKLNNQQHKNKPEKLIRKSIDAVNVANANKNIKKPEALNGVKELNQITTNILLEEAPQKLLKQVLSLLSSVVESELPANEREESLRCVKGIQKKAYDLEKKIKQSKKSG